MAQVVYSPNAIANLEGLHRFLAEKNPEAAIEQVLWVRIAAATIVAPCRNCCPVSWC